MVNGLPLPRQAHLWPVKPPFHNILVFTNEWDALDSCPSRGKCAVNRHLCSLLTVTISCFRGLHPDWTSYPSAGTGEAPASAAFDSSGRQEWGKCRLGCRASSSTVTRVLRVGRYRIDCPINSRFGPFYVCKHQFSTKNVLKFVGKHNIYIYIIWSRNERREPLRLLLLCTAADQTP